MRKENEDTTNYEKINGEIAEKFHRILTSINKDEKFNRSWSNWGFG